MGLLPASLTIVALLLLATPAPSAAAGSAAAECAVGPMTSGDTVYGTPCDDLIVVPSRVETVRGGGGDDVIVPGPIAAASPPCPGGCFLGIGSQVYEGGPGDDIVFGQRGNDTLRGGEGNDHLFGGIGDDLLGGGPGNDRLGGGFGADSIDGEAGNDYVHGDGTIDRIADSGGAADTLSYATGVTPGFGGAAVENAGYEELLPPGAERGVFLDLGAPAEDQNGNNGIAALGGGVDEVAGAGFETVIGTPFSDYIVGTAAGQTIHGGAGPDAILGEGGADTLDGGAGDDYVDGGATGPRDASKVSAGLMVPGGSGYSQLYLVGSGGRDVVAATYSPGPPASVTFRLEPGSVNPFDPGTGSESGCGAPSGSQLVCTLSAPLDSLVLAGMGGFDAISATGFPATATVITLGGDGSDALVGQPNDDVLVDGPDAGADQMAAGDGDDALLHNGGADQRLGGSGNDLFLSVSICDGDLIAGGADRDNASWARLEDERVGANLGIGKAGEPGGGGSPVCAAGGLNSLQEIEDLEGSAAGDVFYGDAGPNQLLGHRGPDVYSAAAGNDTILANSGAIDLNDADPAIDCGADVDRALVDHPQYGNDAAPVNCEAVVAADPNSFQLLPDFPLPTPPPLGTAQLPAAPPRPPARPPRDRTPPRTTITARPGAVLTTHRARRRVALRFASSEAGSTFRCKLDRRPYRPCASPRVFPLRPGRHTVRVVATDPAGNADRTPALVRVRIVRR